MEKLTAAALALLGVSVWAQAPATPKPAELMPGLSTLHHPVSTRTLKRRSSSIRDCAWCTPSITKKLHAPSIAPPNSIRNLPWRGGEWPSRSARTTTCPSIRSTKRSPSTPSTRRSALASSASPIEQAYIDAMAKRFSARREARLPPTRHQTIQKRWRDLTRMLSRRPGRRHALRRQPDEPSPLEALEPRRNPCGRYSTKLSPLSKAFCAAIPDHIGAMHLYIHAVEASPQSRARSALCRPHRAACSRGRTPRPHAGAHLRAHRQLRRRARAECRCSQSR